MPTHKDTQSHALVDGHAHVHTHSQRRYSKYLTKRLAAVGEQMGAGGGGHPFLESPRITTP